jgi:hypothetical protein
VQLVGRTFRRQPQLINNHQKQLLNTHLQDSRIACIGSD